MLYTPLLSYRLCYPRNKIIHYLLKICIIRITGRHFFAKLRRSIPVRISNSLELSVLCLIHNSHNSRNLFDRIICGCRFRWGWRLSQRVARVVGRGINLNCVSNGTPARRPERVMVSPGERLDSRLRRSN